MWPSLILQNILYPRYSSLQILEKENCLKKKANSNHFDLTYLKILYFFSSILCLKDTYTHTKRNKKKLKKKSLWKEYFLLLVPYFSSQWFLLQAQWFKTAQHEIITYHL